MSAFTDSGKSPDENPDFLLGSPCPPVWEPRLKPVVSSPCHPWPLQVLFSCATSATQAGAPLAVLKGRTTSLDLALEISTFRAFQDSQAVEAEISRR